MSDRRKALADLVLGRISREQLVRDSGIDPTDRSALAALLAEATVRRSPDEVEYALTLINCAGALDPRMVPTLCDLLRAPWHYRHEDIAHSLQGLRDPASVDVLASAACMKLPYLAYNESHALARKCVWALADIGTSHAKAHLESLAESSDADVAGYARRRLERWETERARKRGD